MANKFMLWETAKNELAGLYVQARRLMGFDSPMNVWRKQFSSGWLPSTLVNELRCDMAFLSGESWGPKIGTTLNIRRPQRFEVNRIA